MNTSRIVPIILVLGIVLWTACGGSAGSKTAVPDTTTTAQPTARSSGTPTGPTPDATEEQLVAQLRKLHDAALPVGDVPFGFRLRNDQPISKQDLVTANIGILALATYFKNSDAIGAWATFYTREQPATALSSIVYEFSAPASASGLISTISALTTSEYPAATAVDRVESDKVGDLAQMMRYHVPGARTLEYTWAQGGLAGQIVLRYSGDVESPDDVAQIVALARRQSELMAKAVQ